jgi:hypothetical protein
MLGQIEFDKVQPLSEDQKALRMLLQQLVGEKFLFFRSSYGEELTLHFGHPVPYRNKKLKDRRHGSYIIGTMCSPWTIRPGGKPLVIAGFWNRESAATTDVNLSENSTLESSESVAPDAVITTADARRTSNGFALFLELSDGTRITVFPAQAEQEDEEEALPDWEIFTPIDRYLEVGPGLHWSYVDSTKKLESHHE